MYTSKNNGFEIKLSDDLSESMSLVDESIAYTQEGVSIEDEEGNTIAYRQWSGCRDGFEEQENPIDYGDFGYYTDWQIVE